MYTNRFSLNLEEYFWQPLRLWYQIYSLDVQNYACKQLPLWCRKISCRSSWPCRLHISHRLMFANKIKVTWSQKIQLGWSLDAIELVTLRKPPNWFFVASHFAGIPDFTGSRHLNSNKIYCAWMKYICKWFRLKLLSIGVCHRNRLSSIDYRVSEKAMCSYVTIKYMIRQQIIQKHI